MIVRVLRPAAMTRSEGTPADEGESMTKSIALDAADANAIEVCLSIKHQHGPLICILIHSCLRHRHCHNGSHMRVGDHFGCIINGLDQTK